VEVNGQVVVAGAAAAETISANIEAYPGFAESWIRVAGDVIPADDSPAADAAWLSKKLEIGDTVVVRVIESESPAAPTLSRSDPSVDASDGVQLVCSFCGKSHEETQKMYSGLKAMICNECIALMHQMTVDDGVQQ
jgi:hypothetical protein